jgi:hypothetical protein
MPRCCQEHLVEVIHYLAELFDKKKIRYWMHFGTLLGAVREKGIIPWDSDGDLCVRQEDKEKVRQLLPRMKRDGYHFMWYREDLWQVHYSPTNKVYCDLWFYREASAKEHAVGKAAWTELSPRLYDPLEWKAPETEEKIMNCPVSWMNQNHTCDFPAWFVDKTWPYELNGRSLPGPRHGPLFCELLYGPGWAWPAGKSTAGLCGNFYSLSTWLQVVAEAKRKSLHVDAQAGVHLS